MEIGRICAVQSIATKKHTAEREIGIFFNDKIPTTAIFNNCTLCLVKPHAMVRSCFLLKRCLSSYLYS